MSGKILEFSQMKPLWSRLLISKNININIEQQLMLMKSLSDSILKWEVDTEKFIKIDIWAYYKEEKTMVMSTCDEEC